MDTMRSASHSPTMPGSLLPLLLLLLPGASLACTTTTTAQGLMRMDCSNQGLTSFPDNIPSDVSELDVSDNPGLTSLTSLPALPNLRTLRMDRCGLTELPSDAFRFLYDLQTLSLSENQISDIAVDAFSHNAKVSSLHLDGNRLQQIRNNIFNGMTFTELHLGSNQLSELPPEVFFASSISSLTLSHNQFSSLSAASLEPIRSSLELFDCSHNRRTLNIEDTAFKDTRLRELVLNNSSLEQIGFLQYITTSFLDLGDNRGMLMDRINSAAFARAQVLSLRNVSLHTASIASFMQNFKEVIRLDLSYNHLVMFPAAALAHMSTTLKTLNLAHNSLQIIPPDLGLYVPQLSSLSLERNSVSMLFPRDLQHFVSLTELNLQYNRLQLLNEEMWPHLDKVTTIELNGNPFHCNCEMAWFRRWLGSRQTYVGVDTCGSPRRDKIWSLEHTDFVCTAPNITYMTPNTTIREGDSVYLSCSSQSDPAAEVEWRSPQGEVVSITPSDDRSNYKTLASWHLQSVSARQAGWYTCTAKNREATASRSIYISVISDKPTTTITTTPTPTTTPTTTTTTTVPCPPTVTCREGCDVEYHPVCGPVGCTDCPPLTTIPPTPTCPPTVTCREGCEVLIDERCGPVGCVNCQSPTTPTAAPTTTPTTTPTPTTTTPTTTTMACPPAVECPKECEIEINKACNIVIGCVNCKTTLPTLPPTPPTTTTATPRSSTLTSGQAVNTVDSAVDMMTTPTPDPQNFKIIIIPVVILGAAFLALLLFLVCLKRRKSHHQKYDVEESYDARVHKRHNMPDLAGEKMLVPVSPTIRGGGGGVVASNVSSV